MKVEEFTENLENNLEACDCKPADMFFKSLPHDESGTPDYSKIGEIFGSSLLGIYSDVTHKKTVPNNEYQKFLLEMGTQIVSGVKQNGNPLFSVALGCIKGLNLTDKMQELISGFFLQGLKDGKEC